MKFTAIFDLNKTDKLEVSFDDNSKEFEIEIISKKLSEKKTVNPEIVKPEKDNKEYTFIDEGEENDKD